MAKAGQQGGKEEGYGDDEQEVAVSIEISGAANKEQGDDVTDDADGSPRGLQLSPGGIPSHDDHVAQAIEERDNREQRRIAEGHSPSIDQVHHHGQAQDQREKTEYMGRDPSLRANIG